MKGPRHLWTGDWRSDSRENAEALASRPPLRALDEDEAPTEPVRSASAPAALPPRPVARRRALAAVAGAVIVAGAAVGATSLIGGGNHTHQPPKPRSALAAVPDKPLTPRKGQTRAGAIYNAVSPAVVSVRTSNAEGTAFLVEKKGLFVTNAHVVESSRRVIIRFGRDGNSIEATVLGTDPSSDLAVLRVPPSAIPAGVKPLRFADSRNVRVGDIAIAIGNPFGLDRTATEGIISAIGRDIQAPNGFSIDNVIQTDAPINPGNSGGPLLDVSAHVIGVTAQIATSGGSQGNVGIGFAVPSNTVRQVLPALERGETIKRAYLGVETGPPDPGRPNGAQVGSVVSGGPADRAGIRPGDVIRTVAGVPVKDATELSIVVEKKQPGDRVPVVVDRGGSSQTLEVTLGTRPTSTP